MQTHVGSHSAGTLYAIAKPYVSGSVVYSFSLRSGGTRHFEAYAASVAVLPRHLQFVTLSLNAAFTCWRLYTKAFPSHHKDSLMNGLKRVVALGKQSRPVCPTWPQDAQPHGCESPVQQEPSAVPAAHALSPPARAEEADN